jgi:nucleolar protein 12
VKPPPKSRYEEPPPSSRRENVEEYDEDGSEDGIVESGDDMELSSVDGDLEDADLENLEDLETDSEGESNTNPEEIALDRIIEVATQKPDRKRKRKTQEEDLEGKYMDKLAKEEEKEEQERQAARRLKRQKLLSQQGEEIGTKTISDDEAANMDDTTSELDSNEALDERDSRDSASLFPTDVPLHESLAPSKDVVEVEKASRTVFLANVSTLAISSKSAKKTLLTHMGSFLALLPAPPKGKPEHKVESLRFRSTAYAGTSLPKKASFVKKNLMAATTKSKNAYVVYSTAFAAREAVKRLNGSVILERHLRVDGVAHPAKTDHRRCVFVGNLGFVDDESLLDQGGENERKRSKIPSDVEEGLWRQFSKAGVVESVRVVRDEKTRVGKGFAYVQFEVSSPTHHLTKFKLRDIGPQFSGGSPSL